MNNLNDLNDIIDLNQLKIISSLSKISSHDLSYNQMYPRARPAADDGEKAEKGNEEHDTEQDKMSRIIILHYLEVYDFS
jgi:hypothetical protein